MSTHILVIGGAGFVGNALVQKLVKDINNFVYILDDYSTSQHHFSYSHVKDCTYYQQSINCIYIKGHSSDIFTLCNTITPSIVYHFGEFSRIDRSWYETDRCFKSNLYGTTRVLDYCVTKKAKLIYSASSAIFDENNITPYTWTKSKMVELIKNYNKWYDLEYIITYFYNVYGPGQISEGPYATVLGIFETQLKLDKPLTVVLPGTQTRCFTHIDDIIDGVLSSVECFKNTDIPISSNDEMSIIEIATYLSANHIYLPERKGDRLNSNKPLKDKLRLEQDWSTKYNLKDYLNLLKEKK